MSDQLAEFAKRKFDILGWHCHVYFTPDTREQAVGLNDAIQDQFKIWDYRWLDHANGLHPTPFFRFQFRREDLASFIEWLTLNRAGLSVLVHAISGDNYFDHIYNVMWLGTPLHLDAEVIRQMEARRAAERRNATDLPQGLLPQDLTGAAHTAGQTRFRPGDDPHIGKRASA
jgi:DOPA 4,5-dioxygenase